MQVDSLPSEPPREAPGGWHEPKTASGKIPVRLNRSPPPLICKIDDDINQEGGGAGVSSCPGYKKTNKHKFEEVKEGAVREFS